MTDEQRRAIVDALARVLEDDVRRQLAAEAEERRGLKEVKATRPKGRPTKTWPVERRKRSRAKEPDQCNFSLARPPGRRP